MTDQKNDEQIESDDSPPSLREELDLPEVRSKLPEIPIDHSLLRNFVQHTPMTESQLEMVLKNIGQFENWREECKRLVMLEYDKDSFSPPDSPGPKSP